MKTLMLLLAILAVTACRSPTSPQKNTPEQDCAAAEDADARNEAQIGEGETCHKCAPRTVSPEGYDDFTWCPEGIWLPGYHGEAVMVDGSDELVLEDGTRTYYDCDDPIDWSEEYGCD